MFGFPSQNRISETAWARLHCPGVPYHNGSKATASAVRMVPDAGFCCVAQELNTPPLTRSERENKIDRFNGH